MEEKAIAVSTISYDDRMEAIASIGLLKGMVVAAQVYDKVEKRWLAQE